MTYTTLISTADLAARLDSCVIVDCRFDLQNERWGLAQYRARHISGAVYANLNEDLTDARTGRNGRHPLPTVEALAATFGRLGIARGTQVVAYDQDTGLFASRLWWSLRYLGHDAVALLDGGWAKWIGEGRPARHGEETPHPATFVPQPRPGMRVGVEHVTSHLGLPGTVLIDARGPDRFEGRNETLDPVAGHIPGAKNIFYKTNLSGDGTMLPVDALREKYEQALGGRAPEDAVMYCGSGVSACLNLLAMARAGLEGTKLFIGSWSEWSSDPARPVETGPGPKA